MTLASLLGLGAALGWGISDFLGGLQARRLPAFAVALWSQLATGAVLCCALLISRTPPTVEGIVWGIGAGVCGSAGLVLFYRGMAEGYMSIVAPVSACGALIPVAVTIARGQAPHAVTDAGIAVAIGGIILVSLHPEEEAHAKGRFYPVLLFALGSAVAFGLFDVLVNRGALVHGASPLWVIEGANVGGLTMLLLVIAARRHGAPWPGRRGGPIVMIGVLYAMAGVFFTAGSTRGNLGVVAVLASLYPVVTVLLARFMLHERLTRGQDIGVALALVGVALLSAG